MKLSLICATSTLLPIILVVGTFSIISSWEDADQTVQVALSKTLLKKAQLLLNNFSPQTPAGTQDIEIQLETLVLLKTEKEALQNAIQNNQHNAPLSTAAQKRWQFFQSNKNIMRFSRSPPVRGSKFQEVTLRMEAPVEVDAENLQTILTILNQNPQLIVTQFKLEKLPAANPLFSLSFTLVKREFTS